MRFTSGRLGRARAALFACALAVSMLAGSVAPAPADTAGQISTRNIILGALAVTAGIIIYNNYEHKVAQANTVVGYTPDGGVVYGDGRIVYPNSGNVVVYLSNNGSVPCTYNGYGVRCQQTHLYAYFPHGYTPACWPPGHCKQYWKEHPGHGHDNDQGENGNGHGHGNGND